MTGIDPMTRDNMLFELRNRTCRVIFTKVNGEQRDMMCTLVEKAIPEDKRPAGNMQNIQYTDEVIRAFDINKQEWRSFKVANVISFV
jgi:hypothetical protein